MYFVFDHGLTDEEHDALCDRQTTLVAKRIVQNQRGTPSMTVEQAIAWLRTHDPEYLAALSKTS